MAKARKSRKVSVNNDANNIALPVLQIEFHAVTPDNVDANVNAIEQLEIVIDDAHADENDVVEMYKVALAQNFLARVDFETAKNAHSCADKYRKYAKDVLNDRIARIFYDARVVPDFVNRSERAGYRFNEKTTMRMRDVARFLAKADSLTNYTRAIFASVVAFNKAGVEFSSHHAFACCSASDKRFANVEHLMTHTREIYGETTQQAQHSMSLNALVEMHALIETRSGKSSVYRVNPESYVANALIAELELV